MSPPLLELQGIVKTYGGLRPLRIERLVLDSGQHIGILGFDAVGAEVLVNLITGATLPDAGTVSLFGRKSAEITESAEWLSLVDRFGIVSSRAVLLEGMSVAQNLAVPFSLDIEPLPDALREQALTAGREVGLGESAWDRPVAKAGGVDRLRVRLARALAFSPDVLLFEHPTVELVRGEAGPIGRDIRAILERRGVGAIALTADEDFASAMTDRVLTLEAATGKLAEPRRGWFGLGGGRFQRNFSKTMEELRRVQQTRRDNELHALEELKSIAISHIQQNATFDPAKFGFVISRDLVFDHAHFANVKKLASFAAGTGMVEKKVVDYVAKLPKKAA